MGNEKKKGKSKNSKKTTSIATTIRSYVISFILLLVIRSFFTTKYYFINGVIFPIWYIALGLGVVCALIYLSASSKKPKARLAIALLIMIMTFFISGNLFSHANHIFDKNEPEIHTAMVEDKIRTGGGKRIMRYRIQITIDGKTFKITVPSNHYYGLREGDYYVVERHNGAFNEPYYIGVGRSNE